MGVNFNLQTGRKCLQTNLELAVLPIPLQARLAAADPIAYKKLSPLN